MDVEELERRLRAARERLDRALQAMTGEGAAAWMTILLHAKLA
jgi:hypothetical protein